MFCFWWLSGFNWTIMTRKFSSALGLLEPKHGWPFVLSQVKSLLQHVGDTHCSYTCLWNFWLVIDNYDQLIPRALSLLEPFFFLWLALIFGNWLDWGPRSFEMGRGPVDTSFLVSVPLVSLRAWASPRCQMHREGHRVFLEGWQAISAEDCEVFAVFLWPCGTTFLRPSSYHNLCHGCVWICFEIVEAFVCQRHTGAPQKRWQCGPLACLHGVTRGQVPFQAWQIQSRHMFGTVKVGSAWASRRNGSARRSQTGSFAGLCSFPSTPSQQSVSAFEWEASKMPATLWWVAFKAWFFASSLGCWDSKTIAGARQWQGRVVHHDVTGALPMAGVWRCLTATGSNKISGTAQWPNQSFDSTWTTWISDAKFQTPIQAIRHICPERGQWMSMAMLTDGVWERWWWKELSDANDSRMSCDQTWDWSRLPSRWPKIVAAQKGYNGRVSAVVSFTRSLASKQQGLEGLMYLDLFACWTLVLICLHGGRHPKLKNRKHIDIPLEIVRKSNNKISGRSTHAEMAMLIKGLNTEYCIE